MAVEPIVLFDNGHHKCLMFDSLVAGEGVQSNQFLIVDGDHASSVRLTAGLCTPRPAS